ncbi:MAG: hypothetical protein AB7O57_19470 [Hyphomicrobiaceae bacterium]
MIIALAGQADSGKALISRFLQERFDFERMRFSDAPIRMLNAAFGLDEDDFVREAKHRVLPSIADRTPKYLLKSLAYDWGRRMVCHDVWSILWLERAGRRDGARIVADDLRFVDEQEAVRLLQGQVWLIERPSLSSVDAQTEKSLRKLTPDVVIHNTSSLPALLFQVEQLLAENGIR